MRRLSRLVVLVSFVPYLALAQSTTPPAADKTAAPATATATPASLLAQAEGSYRNAKFKDAMRDFEQALKLDPKSAVACEGAVRSYLKLDMVQQAWTMAQEGLKQAPNSSFTHTAMGEVLFRKAKIAEAQHEFVTAYNMNDNDARAAYGLYRVYRTASYYGKAKEFLEMAHQSAPQDRDIERAWMSYRPRKERIAWLEKQAEKESDKKDRQWWLKIVDLLKAEEKSPHVCKLAADVTATQVPLRALMPDPSTLEGVEVQVTINGKAMHLMLDTGASGILIKKGPAGGAGLVPVMETRYGGIGDEGTLRGYFSYADSIKIGALEFQNCIVDVTESTNREGRQILPNMDGVIGGDVFSSYLVSIDFATERLTLKPLPKNPAQASADVPSLDSTGDLGNEEQWMNHDRYVAPEMQNYTPFFRFGHAMLVPTKLGNSEPRLFVIDSGAMESAIAPEFAREYTQVRADLDYRIAGLSGRSEKNVERARKAVLQFGHVAQENMNVMLFDMDGISRAFGVEISGFLGYTTLGIMQMDIDYRDGLVNFTYDPKKYRPIQRYKPVR